MHGLRYNRTTPQRHQVALLCLFIWQLASLCLASAWAQSPLRPQTPPTSVPPTSFLHQVEPILTRAGCNQGACHGSQFGKGGLKLSLAAYDPDQDYLTLVKQHSGRRLSFAEPTASLLLKKATLTLPHKGGKRLEPGSADYRTLITWIRQGAPGPNPRDPQIVALHVTPERRFLPIHGTQTLTVRAQFSDGSVRDVTAHTRVTALNDTIATATPAGVVTAHASGETAIMLRYGGLATVARIAVPYRGKASTKHTKEHEEPRNTPKKGERAKALLPTAYCLLPSLDTLLAQRWKELGLEPSGNCSDSTFIRRATLDILGTLPAPEEVKAFQAERDPQKDARLVDRLLERPEYAEFWAVKWGDLLRNSRTTLGEKGMWSLTHWIGDNLRRNRPYDVWVRELLTAQGSGFTQGAVNYYRVVKTPQDLAETTAQLFLGVRLQCAKCHQHPFEKWSQKDYYQFAAFFARVGYKESQEFGPAAREPIVRLLAEGEVTHPKTGVRMTPTPLAFDNGPRLTSDTRPAFEETDRRRLLADWMTSQENRLFAQMVVNRYWAYFLGRGIVHPVDDMRVTNPPSHPALLEALAEDFSRQGYDLKRLIRTLCTTRAYRLSGQATPQNRADTVFYSHFLPRRMSAEVLLDAIGFATGTTEKFPGLPLGTRAIQLPDATIASPFLDTFGRPPRATACECERASEPSLTQALQLLNGDLVNRKVTQPDGRITALLASGKSDQELVEELYYLTLSRTPHPKEREVALQTLARTPTRRQALEDLLWALINTNEFASIR